MCTDRGAMESPWAPSREWHEKEGFRKGSLGSRLGRPRNHEVGVTRPEDNRRIDELVTEQIKGMEGEEEEENND